MKTGPAWAVLTLTMNKKRSESINNELIHVTWEPTWEPEELKDTLPSLLQDRFVKSIWCAAVSQGDSCHAKLMHIMFLLVHIMFCSSF